MYIFRIYDIQVANSEGLLACVESALNRSGIDNWEDHLVGYGADGAAVNFGAKRGVFQRLWENMPWLIVTHCVAHRLELAIRDAMKDTFS